jgi:arylsulfatase A-like enzyme
MNAHTHRPNVLIVLADQLREMSTPPLEQQVALPAMQAMQQEGVRFDHAFSTCPLCTPYRGMFMTGRYPQTTGMIVNFTSTRASEIGLGDVFAHAGYRTGYVGKWHLNRGAFPSESVDFIPEGRARLGFEYWRAYNCHVDYWNGHVNGHDWDTLRWSGYETEGLLAYVREFLSSDDGRPWLLVVAPHQPHWNWQEVCAPEECYAMVPECPDVPSSVPAHYRQTASAAMRHYLAMTVAVDRMMAEVRRMAGRDTLCVFTSDHGTQMGGQAFVGEHGNCWGKSRPHEESIHVPFFATWPGHIPATTVRHELLTPVDIMPSVCGLAGVPVPRTVEGLDMSAAFLGSAPPVTRDAALTMSFHNYTYSPNLIREDGHEWRGVRTHRYAYVAWREGERMLYDLASDPGQLTNLAGLPEYQSTEQQLAETLQQLLSERGDALHPYSYYRHWIDSERRIVRNAFGPLSHPDTQPDWSLLR